MTRRLRDIWPWQHGPPRRFRVAEWGSVKCPGCNAEVMFTAGQLANECGWCGRVVTRGVG